MKDICDKCKGSGTIVICWDTYGTHTAQCPYCGGSGYVLQINQFNYDQRRSKPIKGVHGNPAFPTSFKEKALGYGGMSLRDYIAVHAYETDIDIWQYQGEGAKKPLTREAARYAYADAMIAERDKQ